MSIPFDKEIGNVDDESLFVDLLDILNSERKNVTMNLKHTLAVALITVLVFLTSGSLADTHIFPVEPMTPTEGSISKEDAVIIAENEMVTRENLTLEDFESYRINASDVKLETGEEAWIVMLDEQFCGTDALVTISATNAAILDYQSTNMEIISAVVDQWIEKKGAMSTWSVEDKALFDWLFGASNEYVAPTEAYISKEAAGSIALSAIEQSASSVELSYTFKRLSYTDGSADQYVWLVTVFENGKETYVVHISAIDGSVLDVFRVSNNS